MEDVEAGAPLYEDRRDQPGASEDASDKERRLDEYAPRPGQDQIRPDERPGVEGTDPTGAIQHGANESTPAPHRCDDAEMFDGFELRSVDVADGVRLRVRVGGKGPAIVLLHGHPRTHTTWHRVAPLLVRAGFTVVCPDLRGYGRSTAPPRRPDHSQASTREMANDIAVLMVILGHERFAAVGHDRGSYVAFRLGMEHPQAVTHLVLLDCVPIGEALARADARFAQEWWHWFFFAQPDKPERAILADPDAWYGAGLEHEARMGSHNYADYRSAIHDPNVVVAMLEDYRAGLGVDRAADDTDRAEGRQLLCPTFVGWSARDDMERLYTDVLAVWEPWTVDLSGWAIDSGHHMAEENPSDLATAIIGHCTGAGSP